MTSAKVISLVLRLVAAVIMIQTLYYKFTGQPESVYIFSRIGAEPWGRIVTGILELIASILLLVPKTVAFGALISVVLMTGAITAHLTVLGVEVGSDRGQLFIYALIVLVSGVILLIIHPLVKKHKHASS